MAKINTPNIEITQISISNPSLGTSIDLMANGGNTKESYTAFDTLLFNEDINEPSITGSIVVVDSNNFIDSLNLKGGSAIIVFTILFKDPDQTTSKKYAFSILDTMVINDMADQKVSGGSGTPNKVLIRFASRAFTYTIFGLGFDTDFIGTISNTHKENPTPYDTESEPNPKVSCSVLNLPTLVPGQSTTVNVETPIIESEWGVTKPKSFISKVVSLFNQDRIPGTENKPLNSDSSYNDIWIKSVYYYYPMFKFSNNPMITALLNYIKENTILDTEDVDIIKPKATPKKPIVDFMFWEDLDSYNFKSISRLVEENTGKELTYKFDMDENETNSITSMEVIKDLETVSLFNDGVYAAEYVYVKPNWASPYRSFLHSGEEFIKKLVRYSYTSDVYKSGYGKKQNLPVIARSFEDPQKGYPLFQEDDLKVIEFPTGFDTRSFSISDNNYGYFNTNQYNSPNETSPWWNYLSDRSFGFTYNQYYDNDQTGYGSGIFGGAAGGTIPDGVSPSTGGGFGGGYGSGGGGGIDPGTGHFGSGDAWGTQYWASFSSGDGGGDAFPGDFGSGDGGLDGGLGGGSGTGGGTEPGGEGTEDTSARTNTKLRYLFAQHSGRYEKEYWKSQYDLCELPGDALWLIYYKIKWDLNLILNRARYSYLKELKEKWKIYKERICCERKVPTTFYALITDAEKVYGGDSKEIFINKTGPALAEDPTGIYAYNWTEIEFWPRSDVTSILATGDEIIKTADHGLFPFVFVKPRGALQGTGIIEKTYKPAQRNEKDPAYISSDSSSTGLNRKRNENKKYFTKDTRAFNINEILNTAGLSLQEQDRTALQELATTVQTCQSLISNPGITSRFVPKTGTTTPCASSYPKDFSMMPVGKFKVLSPCGQHYVWKYGRIVQMYAIPKEMMATMSKYQDEIPSSTGITFATELERSPYKTKESIKTIEIMGNKDVKIKERTEIHNDLGREGVAGNPYTKYGINQTFNQAPYLFIFDVENAHDGLCDGTCTS